MQLKSTHGTTDSELREALLTMEELSMTAAEEIESRDKTIQSLNEELSTKKNVTYDYEVKIFIFASVILFAVISLFRNNGLPLFCNVEIISCLRDSYSSVL